LKIYRIADEIEEDEIEEIDLTDSNNWIQNNYRWDCGDYTIDNDTPTEQFEVYFNKQYIDIVDSFDEAMSLAEDHKNGYVDVQDKKEITPYDIIESKFGYTDDPKKAGYIMADGRMVNLNRPHIDHRAVTVDGSTKSMQKFIADGNIRLIFNNGYAFFDIKVKPTYAQQKIISEILEEASDGAEISIDNGLPKYNEGEETYPSGDQFELKRFESYPNSSAVLGEINSFYGKGKASQFSKFLSNSVWRKVSSNILNNLQFVLSPSAASAGHEIVYIDVDKFDTLFSKETDFYIGEGGSGAPWMPNKWNLPGGGVEDNESLEQAAIRECQEETGISIGGLTKINENVDTNDNFQITIFHTKIKNSNVNMNFESSDYAWVDKNTYQPYDYVPYVKSAISKVIGI